MDKKLNVVLLIDYEPVYAPYIIKKIINDLDSSLILKAVVFTYGNYRKVSEKKNKEQVNNLYGYFNNFILNIYYNYKSINLQLNNKQNHFHLLEQKGIEYKITNNINSKEIVDFIKSNEIDILFSLTHHILKKEILNAPRLICINRHTGKLPNYAGLMSCLYTMLDQKDRQQITITQTMHTMTEKIDAGEILMYADYAIPKSSSLFHAYTTLYKDTVSLFNKAVKRYINHEMIKQDMSERTYYSFPEKYTAKEYRKHFKIFKFKELLNNMGLEINGGGNNKSLSVYSLYSKYVNKIESLLLIPSIRYGGIK